MEAAAGQPAQCTGAQGEQVDLAGDWKKANKLLKLLRVNSSFSQVSGESESVSHSHINGSTMATLRAHDAVALELTMSIVDLFNRGTFKLTEPVLFQVKRLAMHFGVFQRFL